MLQAPSSTNSPGKRRNSKSTQQSLQPRTPLGWRSAVAWGAPLSLAVFFFTWGFEAHPVDLFTRWTCVILAALLGRQLLRPQPSPAFPPLPQEQPVPAQLLQISHALVNVHLPIMLQEFLDEITTIIPCRGALLILLDRRQEEPEHILTCGKVSASVGSHLPSLLPKEIFLEAIEQRAIVLNSPQELHHRLGSLRGREFAQQNLFIGCIRRHQHLAFLLLADKTGADGFCAQDTQNFTLVREAAAVAIENARLFDDIQMAERQHRALLHGLISAQEKNSKLIAEEWQERIGKKLFTALQGLRSFQSLIAQRVPESRERFLQLTAEIDEIAALVRGLTNELHPSVLDDFGVADAIREYVSDVFVNPEEPAPLQITVQADGVDQQLPNEAKLLLFRITQEALRNIRKHADAKNVQIAFVQEHSGVSLMIKDDGKGFNPGQSHPGHFGLQYMKERAEACGGTFRVVSAQGQGTEVYINLPSTGS